MKHIIGIMNSVIGIVAVFFVLSLAAAATEFDDAEALIKQKIPCDQLSEDQLELMGDYYMEQMHPGKAHEQMDAMMGGDGSDELQKIHIQMARSFYCGDTSAMKTMRMMNGGMMSGGDMMNRGMMGGDMMNRGMMKRDNNYGYGRMGNSSWGIGVFGLPWLIGSLVLVALIAFVFSIVFWWTYKVMIKRAIIKGKKDKE